MRKCQLSARSPVEEPRTEGTSGDTAHRTESPNLVASLELDVRPRTNIREEKEEGPERKLSVVERDVQSQTKLPRVSNTGFRPHVLPELNPRDLAAYKGSKDPRLCEPRLTEEDKYQEKPGELVKIPQWYQLRLQENSAGTSEKESTRLEPPMNSRSSSPSAMEKMPWRETFLRDSNPYSSYPRSG